jgi:GntR family transcriptional regulator, transcriptional repressor for pyruvate dehydrogenase complex
VAKLKRVKTTSLRSKVYIQLKSQLMQGVWKIGERLPSENELCQTFGVSRITVRAAIQQLEILGLVETRHGGGTFVRDFSTIDAIDVLHPMIQLRENRDIITVLEYRKIIEKGTIGLVVSKLTDKDIEFLEKTYTLMVKYDGGEEREKQASADSAFHYRLAQMTQNPIILKVYELIKEIMSTAMVDIVGLLGTEIGLRYHRMLIDALKKRDKALCESLMEAHIEETIQAILKRTLAQTPRVSSAK